MVAVVIGAIREVGVIGVIGEIMVRHAWER